MSAVVQLAGWQIFFVLVSVLALPAFWLARRIGSLDVHKESVVQSVKSARMTWLGWGAVGALLAQFIGMSSIWSFLERLGHAKSIDTLHLSLAMSATAIASMIGSLAVGIFAHRVRGLQGIAVAFVVFILSISGLWLWNDWRVYLVAGVLFMLSWSVYFPFQFGMLAEFDRGGRLAAIMPAVTGAAFTIGPALGGVLMAKGGIGVILAWGFACLSMSTLGCVGLYRFSMGGRLRQRDAFRGEVSPTEILRSERDRR
jgi:predicted MFS family arabinose efflux permease